MSLETRSVRGCCKVLSLGSNPESVLGNLQMSVQKILKETGKNMVQLGFSSFPKVGLFKQGH